MATTDPSTRTTPALARVLVVDDDKHLLDQAARWLARRPDWHVATAENGREALSRLATESFDVVVTDLIMPEVEGLETIQQIRRRHPDVRIVAMSGGGGFEVDLLRVAVRLGAQRVLRKPFPLDDLASAVAALASA